MKPVVSAGLKSPISSILLSLASYSAAVPEVRPRMLSLPLYALQRTTPLTDFWLAARLADKLYYPPRSVSFSNCGDVKGRGTYNSRSALNHSPLYSSLLKFTVTN